MEQAVSTRNEASAEAAEGMGLRYIGDDGPGIRREPHGDGFRYRGPDGKRIKDEATLARVKALGIPPAYADVWICPVPDGYIQATGRDARGRKQYRYHPDWRRSRDESKYTRVIAFGQMLPAIRARVDADLSLPGLPREKVLATVVRLLETTLIRVGNKEYAKKNKSYGLTTMRDRHVTLKGSAVQFRFRGKSGKDHAITLRDQRLAKVVKRCRDLPGQDLFQYIDEQGKRQTIGSADVNNYLRETSGQEFTAKDFRTWAGTVLAALALRSFGVAENQRQSKQNIVRAIEQVAEQLGNTPTICRKCYVHPSVLDAYLDGALVATIAEQAEQELEGEASLRPEEREVLAFLRSL